jgi:hypothetical protein
MEEIDLNLENYELDDILNLFSLQSNYNGDDLKKAKHVVLKMHPDKSGLDKKYFLFFKKAFDVIVEIYKFRLGEKKQREDLDESISDESLKLFKSGNFNKKFNELFNKVKIHDSESDNGYGSWFKSDEDIEDTSDKKYNKDEMNTIIESKKKRLMSESLTIHKDISIIDSGSNYYGLERDTVKDYSSDIFSNLQYEDLKKAHTETVVPVSNVGFKNKDTNSQYERMKLNRGTRINMLSMEESRMQMNQNNINDNNKNMKRAYNLIKQNDAIKQSNDIWWASIRQLKNK